MRKREEEEIEKLFKLKLSRNYSTPNMNIYSSDNI